MHVLPVQYRPISQYLLNLINYQHAKRAPHYLHRLINIINGIMMDGLCSHRNQSLEYDRRRIGACFGRCLFVERRLVTGQQQLLLLIRGDKFSGDYLPGLAGWVYYNVHTEEEPK